jgi:hypothetical protein
VNKEIVMEQELKSLMDKYPTLDSLGAAGTGSRDELRQANESVTRAAKWLGENPDKAGDSYELKHEAEKTLGYVTNGALIAAALLAGRECRFGDGPNVEISLA